MKIRFLKVELHVKVSVFAAVTAGMESVPTSCWSDTERFVTKTILYLARISPFNVRLRPTASFLMPY